MSYTYITTWANCVAYPDDEAMREPEDWDKRRVEIPTSFLYP